MRKLYLHVGQDKTGSSYLQSFLATNVQKISIINDIFYPSNIKVLRAREGKITSGNSMLFSPDFVKEIMCSSGEKSILFSGEKLFRQLPQEEFKETLNVFLQRLRVDSVECLLFIRNPIEHMQSSYQQAVKRGGYTKGMSDFSKQYWHVKKVADFVKFCKENSVINLTIKNYSKRRNSILNELCSWLGVDLNNFELPKVSQINRSMTLAELHFQRVFNQVFGRDASFISDALCNELPLVESQNVIVDEDSVRFALGNVTEYCQMINDYSKELNNGSDEYELSVPSGLKDTERMEISVKQIEVIANSLSKKFGGFIKQEMNP